MHIAHVTHRYGTTVAVRNLSLELVPGEWLTLLGPPDAGKSTVLRLLAGRDAPSEGTIRARAAGDAAPPDPPAVELATPEDAVPAEGAGVIVIDDLRVHARYAAAADRIAALRRVERGSDTTVVYATRDAEEAMAVSDRVAVLRDGVLAQIDGPARVHDLPADEFVASYVGRPPINLVPAILEKDGQAVYVGNQTISLAGRIAEEFCRDVTVGVRPRYVQLQAEPPGWRGRVREVRHDPDGTLLTTVEVENVRLRALGAAPCDVGATVFVRIAPRHLVVFDDRGARLDQQP